MAEEFGWNSSVSGLVQSSFFAGEPRNSTPACSSVAVQEQANRQRCYTVGSATFNIFLDYITLHFYECKLGYRVCLELKAGVCIDVDDDD